CKTDRMHTVIAADENGQPIRVSCGFCHSEHNYRGGPRVGLTPGAPAVHAGPDPRARPEQARSSIGSEQPSRGIDPAPTAGRTQEQQVNAADLPDDVKVKLQSYISGCYGSLTSFNVLFAEEDDQFKGSGGD